MLTEPYLSVPAADDAEVGEGGGLAFPDAALRRLRALTTRLGIPLVVDEVQAGFCRTGDFFAFERAGIVPDVSPQGLKRWSLLPVSHRIDQTSRPCGDSPRSQQHH